MSILGWIIGAIALIGIWSLQKHYIGLTLFRSKILIEVNYKSGKTVTEWYRSFTATHDTTREHGKVTALKWETAEPSKYLYWGMQNIESIRQIDQRVSIWRWFGAKC